MGINVGGVVSWVKTHKAKIAAGVGVVSGYLAHNLPIADALKALVDLFAGK